MRFTTLFVLLLILLGFFQPQALLYLLATCFCIGVFLALLTIPEYIKSSVILFREIRRMRWRKTLKKRRQQAMS